MSGLKKALWPFQHCEKKKDAELKTGPQGENIAVSFLQNKGYTILDRNYRQRFGEIDIVAEDGEVLVFVEVKTRKNNRFGTPFEAVDTRKQIKLSKMAQYYISRNNLEDRAARFDVVAVLLNPNAGPDVEHIPNAFDFQE